jgi:hypothetical protein
MNPQQNKPLRNRGVYKLRDKTLILLKRSEYLSFLFSLQNWNLHGPVEYRVSHGHIYYHGNLTEFTDEDLFDTGTTAKPPALSIILNSTEG